MESKRKQTASYIAVIAGCYAVGMLAALSPPARYLNDYAYDLMLGFSTAWQISARIPTESVVVAIDERTLNERGGMRNIRAILASALDSIAKAKPKAVALDVLLADATIDDPAVDDTLETALKATPNLVLPCEPVISGGSRKWEDALPRFRVLAAEVGHVDLRSIEAEGVNREIPLEEIVNGDQRWALSLQSFRVAHHEELISSPEDVQVGALIIPAARSDRGRSMRILYLRSGIPTVSALEISQRIESLRDKTVFLGITALSAARDRLVNPYRVPVAGVEAHAHAYETIARGRFIVDVRPDVEFLLCGFLATTAGLIFAFRAGWQAYLLGGVLLILGHVVPVAFFRYDVVFPYSSAMSVAWLSTVGAASFRYFFVRSELRRSESEKSRYQQAIHWAAHEMRTPLTAIQGSSEIMTRYALPDEKRLQLSEMINSESKRLARLIQTFLDVERLAEGQMELKRENFDAAGVVETCLQRVLPIADRKKISVSLENPVEGVLTGDRELMEYALYNLLTNAVKYSPPETHVRVTSTLRDGELRLSVSDQGIGMDAKELKSIFKKFYRTKKAEASGEVGTGIGLSIVEQIVTTHGGRMEVTSEPGRGSCFTMIVTTCKSS